MFGRLPASQDMSTWLWVAGLEVAFLLLVIAGWRALKLDREEGLVGQLFTESVRKLPKRLFEERACAGFLPYP